MKRIIAIVAFCLLSVSIFAQTGNADIDLIVVAKWGYIEAIKELIEAGADIDVQDNSQSDCFDLDYSRRTYQSCEVFHN